MYEKRFVAIGVSFFAIGVALGIFLNNCYTLSLCAVFMVLGIASVAFLFVNSKIDKKILSKRITATVFTTAALSFGVLRVFIQDTLDNFHKPYDNCVDLASVKIVDINSSYFDGRIQTSDMGLQRGTAVRIYSVGFNDELLPGDVITGEFKYAYKNTNALRSKGIYLTASCESVTLEKGNGLLYAIRKSVDENSEELFGEFNGVSAISKGVTIGDRSEINSFTFATYQKTGISHLLAISGLHISIIVISIFKGLSFLSLNRNISSILCVIVAFTFSAMVGFSVGALRSAIMISVMLISRMFLMRSDSFTSLFLSLMLFLVINPYSICSVGLQLSFLCCFGLILTSPLTDKINYYFSLKGTKGNMLVKVICKLSVAIVVPMMSSTIASIFSFPVIFFNFDTISAISPIVNVLAIPLFTLALELSVVAYVFAPISIFVARIFSYPAGMIFQFVSNISKFIFNLNLGVVSIHSSLMSFVLAVSIITVLFLIFAHKKRNLAIILSCIMFSVTILFSGMIGKDSHENVIEYGNDGGEYIYCHNREKGVYIDIGGYTVNPTVIYENGNIHLENYVILKYSSSTYRHLERMTSDITVSKIVLPNPINENDMYWLDAIKLLANERNCDIIHFNGGCVLNISEQCNVQIVGERSITDKTTVYIKFGDISVQYLGDNFDDSAECDYAILSDNCKTDVHMIHAKEIRAQSEYVYTHITNGNNVKIFDDKLKIEVNIKESSCRIYEP